MSHKFSFQNKTILVTGATRGIGRALTDLLIARGATVLAVARDEPELERLAQEHLDRVFVLAADLQDLEMVRAVANWVTAEHPDCAGLINNAAIMEHSNLFAEDGPSLATFQREIAINLTAPIGLCNALLPLLSAQPNACIVNVTSGLAISPKASAPVYCATKAGLGSFTKTLRYQCEDAKTRILVSEAVMALVDTGLSRGDPLKKMRPIDAAEEVLEGVEKGKKSIWVERTKMLRILHRLAPSVADRILRNG
ncbi:SDR family oxidoreductase [Falsihalocynthiibacter sp. S25ZX9]|uniref:SDR family oxidoreductase n=1 Tax=Falsihalocynthiibacter sp. S25ZX9 TaxID=3240870 RepID=UPI00350FF10F